MNNNEFKHGKSFSEEFIHGILLPIPEYTNELNREYYIDGKRHKRPINAESIKFRDEYSIKGGQHLDNYEYCSIRTRENKLIYVYMINVNT